MFLALHGASRMSIARLCRISAISALALYAITHHTAHAATNAPNIAACVTNQSCIIPSTIIEHPTPISLSQYIELKNQHQHDGVWIITGAQRDANIAYIQFPHDSRIYTLQQPHIAQYANHQHIALHQVNYWILGNNTHGSSINYTTNPM